MSHLFHNPFYLLGCPVWACDGWKDSLFPRSAARATWLGHYTRCFNTVEGNSTFYGIPAPSTFERWAKDSADGFRFCLKFPRAISHEAELLGADEPLKQFLVGLEILAASDKLGPTFLQLGPHFDGRYFERLMQFLDQLPDEYPYAVEVRHPDWFQPELQTHFFDQLEQRNIDRVIFDSRPLFVSEARDEYEVKSRKRKPRVPIRSRVTGPFPMLRLIGRNDVHADEVTHAIDEWAEVVALWIQQGLNPIVFTHTPDDQFAPHFAFRFHNRLVTFLNDSDNPKAWSLNPVDRLPFQPAKTQGSLFD